ncbi:MAG: serine hydrolase [Candidatus Latescibacterota bacterium]|nr:serine hydrolase [Candidatus Latescibacterota bacterium]
MSDLDGVTTMCQEAIDAGVVPGICLSFGRARGESQRCVLGSAALEPTLRAMSVDTHFDLASLTKVLATTWLTMVRWQEGLDIDAPLESLLPGYYPPDKAGLSIRLLLAHAAGLPSGLRLRDQLSSNKVTEPSTRRDAMEHFVHAPMKAGPAEASLYSDIGPILVGDLLERLNGTLRLDELCCRHLYSPAQMSSTGFLPVTASEPRVQPDDCAATENCPWRGRVVSGQVHDENAFLLDGVAGHAGLFAPLPDLEHVARLLLTPTDTGPITGRSLAEFTRQQQIVEGSTRALGWDTAHQGCPGGDKFSERAFGHTGFTGTSIWIDPVQEIYVVLLTNRVHPTRQNERFLAFRPRLHDVIVESLIR